MNYPRSNHGICQIDNTIYVVGGFEFEDENSSLDTAEKFEGGRWQSIKRCIFR